MKQVFILIACLLFLSGCQGNKISLPKERSYLLVGHVKESVVSFLNPGDGTVIKEAEFPYQVHTVERIDEETILFTGKLETFVRSLNLRTGQLNRVYEFGQGIMAMFFDAKSRLLYLADAKTDSVLFFDYDQRKILFQIQVGKYPFDLEMNDDRTELYVLSSDDNAIYVIDVNERKLKKTIPVMAGSTALFYDGNYLWVGGHGMYRDLNEFIYLYDPKSGELVKKIAVGSMPIFFHDEADLNYVGVLCHGSHELYIVDRRSYEVIAKKEVGTNPYYMISDDSFLYISGMDSNDVSIVDKRSFQLKKIVKVKDGPYAMVIGGQYE